MPRLEKTSQMESHFDVVVAGARCAGASTAMLLARGGARVLMVDPVPAGRDALSTHALMRGGVLQLHRWGLMDAVRKAGAPPVTATTFDYGDEVITVPIKPRDGVEALYAPRRTVLDPILVDAARESGVEVQFGMAVTKIMADPDGRIRGCLLEGAGKAKHLVSADLLIGADGVGSRVARLVGAPVEHEASNTTAVLYGYWQDLPSDEYRWIFRPGIGVGIIPTNGGDACVFVAISPGRFHGLRRTDTLDQSLRTIVAEADPGLAARLTTDRQTGGVRAFAGRPGFLRKSSGPGWALVGDAGYFKDPLTAHGITDAFRDSELLARAFLQHGVDGLGDYQAVRDEAARDLMAVTDRIASLSWSMAEVKRLHHDLSKAMNVGVGVIRGFDGEGPSSGEVRHSPAA